MFVRWLVLCLVRLCFHISNAIRELFELGATINLAISDSSITSPYYLIFGNLPNLSPIRPMTNLALPYPPNNLESLLLADPLPYDSRSSPYARILFVHHRKFNIGSYLYAAPDPK